MTYVAADYLQLGYFFPSGKPRYETEYDRLVALRTGDTIMRTNMQAQTQEIIERGMKRGLSSFELLELSRLSQHP